MRHRTGADPVPANLELAGLALIHQQVCNDIVCSKLPVSSLEYHFDDCCGLIAGKHQIDFIVCHRGAPIKG